MGELHRAWLVLAGARLGPAEARALLERYGDVRTVAALSRRELARAGVREDAIDAIASPDERAIGQALAWLAVPDHHLVHPESGAYPPLLAEIPGAPLVLYARGDPAVLGLPTLAIVGSRNPTRGGVRNAYEFAKHLAGAGFTIASGLAEGIDRAAHEGALAAGGTTVAWLGHGLDTIYPAANAALAERIAASGVVATEFPLGMPPRRGHFPARNRLISGSSLGTLVVEAARRSGSLITARLAAEQGREVFAIPGSIHNALSRGCHQLIREGAKLVESADDILSELGPLVGHLMQNDTVTTRPEPSAAAPVVRDPDYRRLLDVLGHDPVSADELAAQSGLTIEQVSSMLLILELEGAVEALHGGQYAALSERKE
ncbi:MAG TPA: DNA-processing protein DprA [Woeseiaceae bacterium]|nr:DNA-processing protein DprA [Woeseiaceae bacterium]